MTPDILKIYELKAQIDQVLQLALGLSASVEALIPESKKRLSNKEMISEFKRLTRKRRVK